MAKMTLHKRIGLFHVDVTGFKTDCLPFPQKILEAVGRHLPFIAAKRNDVLLNVIKVWRVHMNTHSYRIEMIKKYFPGIWIQCKTISIGFSIAQASLISG